MLLDWMIVLLLKGRGANFVLETQHMYFFVIFLYFFLLFLFDFQLILFKPSYHFAVHYCQKTVYFDIK